MRLAQLSLIAILQLLACDGLGTASETVATLQPQDGVGVSASRVHVGVSSSLEDLLNELLEQARLWTRDGIREQHHNVLRAYQAATRLAVNNHDVYPGEGDRGLALMQIWTESMHAAVEYWATSPPPPPRSELVEIILPRASEDVVLEIPLALEPIQDEPAPAKAAVQELQVPMPRLGKMAAMVCALGAAAAVQAPPCSSCDIINVSRQGGNDCAGGCVSEGDSGTDIADVPSADVCTQSVLAQLEQHYEVLAERYLEARPPTQVPEGMWEEFTDRGSTPVLNWYLDNSHASYYSAWPGPHLKAMRHMVAERRRGVNYPEVDVLLYEYLDKLGGLDHFTSASVVIMGSAVPWYEALALECGAFQTVTIEYNRVQYGDPRMLAIQPHEYWAMDSASRPRFDLGMSISSFEHDGLGRYGDPVNPSGDLEAMAEMEKIIVDGGLLLLALPVAKDALIWNAHRAYGRKRLARMLERWTIEHQLGLYAGIFEQRSYAPSQPLFVLRNTRPVRPHVF